MDTVLSLTIGNDVLALAGGSLSILTSASFAAGLQVTNGTISFEMASTVAGPFSQTSGLVAIAQGATLTLAGTAQFGPYGTGDIDGPGTLATTGTTTLDENVYSGEGLTWSNSGTVDDVTNLIGGDSNGGTATFVNLADASFNLAGDYNTVENDSSTGNAIQPVGSFPPRRSMCQRIETRVLSGREDRLLVPELGDVAQYRRVVHLEPVGCRPHPPLTRTERKQRTSSQSSITKDAAAGAAVWTR